MKLGGRAAMGDCGIRVNRTRLALRNEKVAWNREFSKIVDGIWRVRGRMVGATKRGLWS